MSLQFHPRSGYFWAMPNKASGWAMAAVVLAACGERERFTFATDGPGDGVGPVTEVLSPAADDSIVHEGDPFVLSGRASDLDGVDSVYFDIEGLSQAFPPLRGRGADTVNFGVPISTSGHSGAIVAVRIYAVDLLGQQGGPVSRQFRIE
jgi:hypothetical protein